MVERERAYMEMGKLEFFKIVVELGAKYFSDFQESL